MNRKIWKIEGSLLEVHLAYCSIFLIHAVLKIGNHFPKPWNCHYITVWCALNSSTNSLAHTCYEMLCRFSLSYDDHDGLRGADLQGHAGGRRLRLRPTQSSFNINGGGEMIQENMACPSVKYRYRYRDDTKENSVLRVLLSNPPGPVCRPCNVQTILGVIQKKCFPNILKESENIFLWSHLLKVIWWSCWWKLFLFLQTSKLGLLNTSTQELS